MGYKATEAVMAHSQLKGPAYLLLLVIAHRINDEDGTWPLSIEDLKRDSRLSRSQVFAHVAEAKLAQELNSRRTGRKTVYSLTVYDVLISPGIRTNEASPVRESGPMNRKKTGIRTSDVRESGPLMSGNPDLSTYNHTFTSSTYMAASPREREKATRRPDPLWDAAIAAGLPAPTTKSERGKWNAALKMLREVSATPDDLTARIREYRRKWPNIDCTLMGVVNNWTPLGANGHATHKQDSPADREKLEAEHWKQMEANREFQRSLAAEMEARGIRLKASE